jgi:hypothetical protein
MTDGRLLVTAIICFFIGIIAFYIGFIRLKQKRQIENTPTSKIRSLAIGMVEIFGEATSISLPFKSPLTKKSCVYYKIVVEEYKSQGKSSRWVTLRQDECKESFYVNDDTGKVVVDPKNCELELPKDFSFESGFGKDPSKEIQKYLLDNNLKFENFFGANKKMRFTEYRIGTGDKVYVMGTAVPKPSGEYSGRNEENLMITKGGKNDFYYISDRPEKEVLKSFGWKIFFGIYGGGALILTCLGIIIFYMII